jgi:hypothetical protein
MRWTGVPAWIRPNSLKINHIEAFERSLIKDEKFRIEILIRSGLFFILGTRPDPLSMHLGHCRSLFRTGI